MIKFIAKNKHGDHLVGIGLSSLDCLRLLGGEASLIDVDVMLFEAGEINLPERRGGILIFGGKTDADLVATMRRYGAIPPGTELREQQDHFTGGK